MLISRSLNKAILLSDSVNASLIGLVSITAGCATTTPVFAIIIGAVASVVYILSSQALLKFKVDDVVSAVAVHGFGGHGVRLPQDYSIQEICLTYHGLAYKRWASAWR